ncbi:MAG: hydroxymethylbilane synthase [Mangrovibacterium sp.]
MKETIKIGTRGSKLALWQANEVQRIIKDKFPQIETEIVIIKTKGDKILDTSLSKIGDKGLFTKEIEHALINTDVDIAVHSFKDMPTELPDGLIIGAVLPRADVRDVLVSKDGRMLSEMTEDDKIGTSSLRRKAQLLAYNPKLQIVDIRGNVETRLAKMNGGVCDAIVMAGAGFMRLGYQEQITEFLNEDIMLPAVSQGAVAIEVCENNEEITDILDAVNDEKTWIECMAERCLLRTLEGGCQVPVGCLSAMKDSNFIMTALVADVDGTRVVRESISCETDLASEKAIELGELILEKGAKEILNAIRK